MKKSARGQSGERIASSTWTVPDATEFYRRPSTRTVFTGVIVNYTRVQGPC